VLSAAFEHYQQQQYLTALGLREARRQASAGSTAVAQVVARYQATSAQLTINSTPAELVEQGLDAPPVHGRIATAALLTGATTVDLLDAAADRDAMERLVITLIQDAGRTAAAVDIARRPKITGYVRSLTPPSCSRCAILAGRIYRYSQGFERHPHCDCLMTPTTESTGQDLVTDPTDLLARGQITGLSKADLKAVDLGADLGRVVNVRRAAAGLQVRSSVYSRAGRLTPEGVLTVASDRPQAIELLRKFGYLI
jgi:hypothetical protein